MKKTLIQGALTIILFFGSWLLLAQIDWVDIFRVKQATDKTEEKLGELFWNVFKKSETVNNNVIVINSVDTIVNNICSANNINRNMLKVSILTKDEINAFALPDGHIIIYSGLILNADKQDELTGVICHEIAHIELDHVMKKLVKEVGLSVLISMTTGNGGTEIVKETAKMLSSTAFDRSLEREADIRAVDYLINARVNPAPFADFLYKLSNSENDAKKYLSWISTHPHSKERAEYITQYSLNKPAVYKPILSDETWRKLKEELLNSEDQLSGMNY